MADFEFPEFPPELALVIACCRWPLEEGGAEEIRRRAAAPLDWSRVLAWAWRNRIAPLVHLNLRQAAPGAAPAAVAADLQEETANNAQVVLKQIAEAARVTQLLAEAGIRSMIIKGPVLSLLTFGDPTLRESQDVDLLIDPDRVPEAHRVITQAGYRRVVPEIDLAPHQDRQYRRLRCQFGYHSRKFDVALELHWRLTSNSRLLPLGERALWSRSGPVRLPGADFVTLPDEELFLYLCVHGSVHVWFRLKWLVDIAALLHRMRPDAVERIAGLARSLEVERPLHQALILAHRLLAAPVPAPLQASAGRDRTARRLALAACRALDWHGSPDEPARTRWFNAWVSWQAYRLKPGLRYRWAEFQDQMCSPEDWMRVPLPDRLFFLYLPLRPISLAARKLQSMVSR